MPPPELVKNYLYVFLQSLANIRVTCRARCGDVWGGVCSVFMKLRISWGSLEKLISLQTVILLSPCLPVRGRRSHYGELLLGKLGLNLTGILSPNLGRTDKVCSTPNLSQDDFSGSCLLRGKFFPNRSEFFPNIPSCLSQLPFGWSVAFGACQLRSRLDLQLELWLLFILGPNKNV